MRIVYRMRGLLGDATEDMVNTLDSGKGFFSKTSHLNLLVCKLYSLKMSLVYWYHNIQMYCHNIPYHRKFIKFYENILKYSLEDEDVDNEEVYKMASVMSQCGGLRVMLKRSVVSCLWWPEVGVNNSIVVLQRFKINSRSDHLLSHASVLLYITKTMILFFFTVLIWPL